MLAKMCGLGVNLNLLFGFILIALIIGLAKSEMYSDQPGKCEYKIVFT